MRGIAAALSLAAYCSNIPSLTVPALRHTVLPRGFGRSTSAYYSSPGWSQPARNERRAGWDRERARPRKERAGKNENKAKAVAGGTLRSTWLVSRCLSRLCAAAPLLGLCSSCGASFPLSPLSLASLLLLARMARRSVLALIVVVAFVALAGTALAEDGTCAVCRVRVFAGRLWRCGCGSMSRVRVACC